MKILYVDISLSGHRVPYLKALAENNPGSAALLPELCNEVSCRQFLIKSGYHKKRSLATYLKWLNEIEEIAEQEHVQAVHFLCGDALYRYFGIGLSKIRQPVIVTYHHMLFSRIRVLSYKGIFWNTFGVVHTQHLLDSLNSIGIGRAVKIEYPMFLEDRKIDRKTAREALGLADDIPCLLTLGGTQRYKGVDLLLKALDRVDAPFQLYLTGKTRDTTEEMIRELSAGYSDRVFMNMRRLSDEEYQTAIAAADILVLPYRKEFDGASGTMLEAVWNRKYIVGASHGSMGRIIRENDLGSVFKTEDIDDLAAVLNKVLKEEHVFSEKAEQFRETLRVEVFLKKYEDVYSSVTGGKYRK